MSSVTDVSMGDHIDLMIKESESIAAGLAAAVIAIPENIAHTRLNITGGFKLLVALLADSSMRIEAVPELLNVLLGGIDVDLKCARVGLPPSKEGVELAAIVGA